MMESVEKQKVTWYRMNKDELRVGSEVDKNGVLE
jgi:hypothetical protein